MRLALLFLTLLAACKTSASLVSVELPQAEPYAKPVAIEFSQTINSILFRDGEPGRGAYDTKDLQKLQESFMKTAKVYFPTAGITAQTTSDYPVLQIEVRNFLISAGGQGVAEFVMILKGTDQTERFTILGPGGSVREVKDMIHEAAIYRILVVGHNWLCGSGLPVPERFGAEQYFPDIKEAIQFLPDAQYRSQCTHYTTDQYGMRCDSSIPVRTGAIPWEQYVRP